MNWWSWWLCDYQLLHAGCSKWLDHELEDQPLRLNQNDGPWSLQRGHWKGYDHPCRHVLLITCNILQLTEKQHASPIYISICTYMSIQLLWLLLHDLHVPSCFPYTSLSSLAVSRSRCYSFFSILMVQIRCSDHARTSLQPFLSSAPDAWKQPRSKMLRMNQQTNRSLAWSFSIWIFRSSCRLPLCLFHPFFQPGRWLSFSCQITLM